ncbi:hypothetical protein PHJA_001250200 [Phtheirospermum japonicum]|uniref:Uncharacterized protein n=1 Tax=Phtheirospermum japonicum TaxID=374723 RepID=A0A830BYS2_9LAMI|nr:hypothetical protein PHJA_001250200 [Phtheirospermum japonicum]
MEKFTRTKSSRENPELYPSSMSDLRSYITSTYTKTFDYTSDNFKEMKIKKGSNNNKSKIRGSASTKNWDFNMDPELQRKKRVAGYKAYALEGKMKSTFRKSFRWMKDVVHGFW